MKVEVRRLGVLRTGLFLAVFYGVFSLLLLPFVTLGALAHPGNPAEIRVMVLMLLLYPLMGFIGGVIMAAVYNLVAAIVGGIQFEMNQSGDRV